MANITKSYYLNENFFISCLDAEKVISCNVYTDVMDNEGIAYEFFELLIWCGQPFCNKCLSDNVVSIGYKNGDINERNLYRCRKCQSQFSIKTASFLKGSKVNMKDWAFAFTEACFGEDGVSASSIHKYTNISYKSSLDMVKRMRKNLPMIINV